MSRRKKAPSRNPQRVLPEFGRGPHRGKVYIKGEHVGWLTSYNGEWTWHLSDGSGISGTGWNKRDAGRDLVAAWLDRPRHETQEPEPVPEEARV